MKEANKSFLVDLTPDVIESATSRISPIVDFSNPCCSFDADEVSARSPCARFTGATIEDASDTMLCRSTCGQIFTALFPVSLLQDDSHRGASENSALSWFGSGSALVSEEAQSKGDICLPSPPKNTSAATATPKQRRKRSSGSLKIRYALATTKRRTAAASDATRAHRCDVCGREFTSNGNLYVHKKFVHDNVRPYPCTMCAKRFGKPSLLRHHMATHTGVRPFECHLCDRAYPRQGKLNSHIRNVHERRRPFACQLCDHTYYQASHLEVHMRSHTGEKPFQCDLCGKHFFTKSDRDKHVKTVHCKQRDYACAICAKTFSTSSTRSKHVLLVHKSTDLRPCPVCGKRVKGLKQHLTYVHDNLRPYRCPKCDKAFGKLAAVATHMRTHTGEKPFACDQCGKAFTLKGTLTDHVRAVHGRVRDNQCDKCGKAFYKLSHLKRHQATHGAESQHCCPICAKRLSSAYVVRQHVERIHGGLK